MFLAHFSFVNILIVFTQDVFNFKTLLCGIYNIDIDIINYFYVAVRYIEQINSL